jgi:hypothetical protein
MPFLPPPITFPFAPPLLNLTLSASYDKLIETENNSLVGDIAPYGDGELVKFIRTDLTGAAVAKPQFVSRVFIAPTITSESNGVTASFYNNDSYTSTNLTPWYNNYSEYFSNIRGYSQNHSIVPEFIISNYDNLATSEARVTHISLDGESYYTGYYGDTNYLKFNGREENSEVSTAVYEDIPINSFIDKKSNKIKFVFNGIKKLLPYNGFYPSQYSQIIAKRFADSYFTSSLSSTEKQAMIQPLFGPGALFNTIKAGIAMSYPTCVTSSDAVLTTASLYDYSSLQTTVKPEALNNKFTFDNLLNPDEFFTTGSKYLYLDPTRYSEYFYDYFGTRISLPSYSGSNLSTKAGGASYKLTINNFLAETVNFFLNNSQLTSFVSAPESEFNVPSGQNDYGMKIKITKNSGFSMFSSDLYLSGSNVTQQETLFGPPVTFYVFPISYRLYSPYVYNRYSPVYLNGHSELTPTYGYSKDDNIITIFCRDLPSGSKPTVQTLLKNLYIATGSTPQGNVAGVSYDEYVELHNGKNGFAINTFLDSLFLKQKVSVKQNTINPTTGEPVTATDTKDIYRWSIQTKFESPLIDYNDSSVQYSNSTSSIACTGSNGTPATARLNIYDNAINGIWNTRGTIPKDGESIQVELYDDLFGDFSLFNLCGFKKETKTISQIADQREINEAVVVLPYTKRPLVEIRIRNPITLKDISDEPGKYFLTIDENKINTALGLADYKKLSINKIKNILDTSPNIDANNELVKLMKAMVKYNVPPHLNWLKDKTIKPFVMYVAEFNHVLDKQDLADIWQGNMPKIAQAPEEQQVVVEHVLDSDNFYDRKTLNMYLSAGMYIKVFKVKQRGKMSYSEITAHSEDDAVFKTEFGNRWYSYNWPYDYFSLVELLNIKAGEVYENTGSA